LYPTAIDVPGLIAVVDELLGKTEKLLSRIDMTCSQDGVTMAFTHDPAAYGNQRSTAEAKEKA
jgi:hypothetical protein